MSLLASIHLNPVLPVWLLILLVLAFGSISWWTYSQCSLLFKDRLILWGLRLAAFVLLAAVILLPTSLHIETRHEAPALAVVCDISSSMVDVPDSKGRTRLDAAKDLLESRQYKKAVDGFRILPFGIGEELQEGLLTSDELSPTASHSYLTRCLNRLNERLRAENLAGILFLTDGLDQSNDLLSQRSSTVPVYLPELEEEREITDKVVTPDYSFSDISHPNRATINREVSVTGTLRRKNGTGDSIVNVKLLHDSTVLRSSEVSFTEKDKYQTVSFSFDTSTLGDQVYSLVIDAVQDSQPDNNSRDFIIQVTDKQKRILYLEGLPRWEFKFLKRAISSDKDLQLNAFLQAGNGTFINFAENIAGSEDPQTPDFSAEGLKNYSVVILGNLLENALKQEEQEALGTYLQNGGSLLVLGGHLVLNQGGLCTTATLKPLLPVQSQPDSSMHEGHFQGAFTAAGRRISAFEQLSSEEKLPEILSVWEPVTSSPAATVLLSTLQNQPLIVTGQMGTGRVAIMLSDSFWRWQLGSSASANQTEQPLYSRFMLQLLQWLAPDVSENNDKALSIAVASREIELHSRCLIGGFGSGIQDAADISCRITSPDGKEMLLAMNKGTLSQDFGFPSPRSGVRCDFIPTVKGTYKIELLSSDGSQSEQVMLTAILPQHESTGAPINRDWMKRLAEKTGGAFIKPDKLAEAMSTIKRVPSEYKQISEKAIWNRWPWLVLLILLYSLEWYWRRKRELL